MLSPSSPFDVSWQRRRLGAELQQELFRPCLPEATSRSVWGMQRRKQRLQWTHSKGAQAKVCQSGPHITAVPALGLASCPVCSRLQHCSILKHSPPHLTSDTCLVEPAGPQQPSLQRCYQHLHTVSIAPGQICTPLDPIVSALPPGLLLQALNFHSLQTISQPFQICMGALQL